MFQTSVEKMKLFLLTFNIVEPALNYMFNVIKKRQIFMLIMFKVYNIDINGGRSVVVMFVLQHIFFF